MVYTLQHGVQKTWTDHLGKTIRYGGTVLGFALIALVVGNVWYAMRYKPVSQPVNGGSHQVARTPITLANATIDQGVGAGDVQPSVPAATMLMSGSHWTFSSRPNGFSMTNAGNTTGVINSGSLPAGTPPADATTGPTDPGTGTAPADPGTGTTNPGNGGTGIGTTGGTDPTPPTDPVISVPPVTIIPPVPPVSVDVPVLGANL